MNKSSMELMRSLVGSSIEFSFKKKLSGAVSVEDNIRSARRHIARDVQEALSVGGELCVMTLAELTYHYMQEMWYMAVRGAIEMRRYRPAVLEYMKLPIYERAERLFNVLSEKRSHDKNRDLKITALRYFLATYPSRAVDFKKVLTREEYMLVV